MTVGDKVESFEMDFLKGYNSHVYGIRAVIELLESGRDVAAVFISRTARGPLMTELRKLLKEKQVPSRDLPQQAFKGIHDKNHQGVVAALSPITYENIEWLLPRLFESGNAPLLLILDGITDVRNFGAICRSASCFGVHAVIIPVKGGAQVNEFAIKASAGALLHIPVCRVRSLPATFDFLKDSGVRLIGCSEKGEKEFFQEKFQLPTAIIAGSEDQGISPSLLKSLDQLIRIPITGKVDSLNVSVATGIVLSEAHKQRIHVER